MTAEVAIARVVQLLRDLLIHKVNFLRGFEDQVHVLIAELNRLQSFLRDADEKQAQDNRIRGWILDIRDMALDAEDAIEMLIANSNKPWWSSGFLESWAVVFPNHEHHLKTTGKVINTIQIRIASFLVSRESYGIKVLGEPPQISMFKARRRLAPWEKDEHVVGMEDDVKMLLESIMDEKNKGLSVIPIVGMNGIGKTTLAHQVYKHPRIVSSRFDCRAWVAFSTTPGDTIKKLIMETTSSEQGKQYLYEEIKKLEKRVRDRLYLNRKLEELFHKQLEGKTYFIVVDDAGEKEDWDSLMPAFPNKQGKRSILLLTTRFHAIAKRCQILHEMKALDRQESIELFLKSLTNSSNQEFPKGLEQIGRQILEKCNGIPLAITLMGGLLAETQTNKEWQETLNALGSNFGAEISISTTLKLSYQNISQQLKFCFLCLAFFSEDATIPVKRLVNIIVGQGLTSQTVRTMAEEIVRSYLDELINRNIVQVKDLTLDNRVKSCYLHDSLRMLCLRKAAEEIDLHILKGNYRIPSHKCRYLVVQCAELQELHEYDLTLSKHIRALFVLNVGEDISMVKSSYWKSFQNLKSLDLDCDIPLERLPSSFRLLLGLKQLRIHRQPNKIFFNDLFNPSSRPLKLPIWLNTLKRLEVLDLGIELVEFPILDLEMDGMRHIHAYCVHGPIMTNSWKNIETLKYIRFKDWMRSGLSLTEGCQVRELGIIMVDESSEVSASLQKLDNLVRLYLVWNYLLPIHAAINIPHLENLTKLKLNGMMRECPSADNLPQNLTHLTLENSFLDEDPMQELGKLPKLLYLKLKDHSYMGERMQVLQDGFPCLIGVQLREMYELRKVVIKEGGMPQLKLLQTRDCHALDTKNLLNKSYQLQILDTI